MGCTPVTCKLLPGASAGCVSAFIMCWVPSRMPVLLLCRGPISALFGRYLWMGCTPITNKLTIVAYICIYIALAIAWPVAVIT